MFTIGKLAGQAELSIDAIRYYEKEKLLRPARKTEAGYRLYDQNALRRIRFIKQAHDVRTIAIAKQAQLADKVKAMKAMSRALSKLIAICNDETKPIDKCPILTALEASLGK